MNRYVCIHGHFYQPPRENPWTGVVERQDVAFPWHDWNEEVTEQCYGPNASARILDEKGRIVAMRNCYESISFNIGPTLLRWLHGAHPWIYRSVIEADRLGAARFGGHGPAMAQVYGHAIMPLCSDRDKRTHVVWGISDFRRRFRRDPEGMWLPETAVDVPTLEVLAAEGIKFTVLAPHQKTQLASDGPMDIGSPYLCRLPSGSSIALFFYDGGLAQDMAFGSGLDNGRFLARRMIAACPDMGRPVLEHVAVDGETFGHHHRFGDMALAACLDELDRSEDVALTVYGQFLEISPPEREAEIIERSSWSCSHGVERWRSDCGCSDGGHDGWHQKWRAPLRSALDELQHSLDGLYGLLGSVIFPDPWGTRDRSEILASHMTRDARSAFFRKEAGRELSPWEEVRAMTLMEMERCSLLMFSSCGWFFDDISRIESIQILRYAARALELAETLGESGLRKKFMEALEKVPSNVEEFSDGKRIFSFFVEPGAMDLVRVGAHMALYFLLDIDPERTEFPMISWREAALTKGSSRDADHCFGFLTLRCGCTGDETDVAIAALWWGGRKMLCGAVPLTGGATRDSIMESLSSAVVSGSPQALQKFFGHRLYSVRHLFSDSRDRVIAEVERRCEDRLVEAIRPVVERDGNLIDPCDKGSTSLGLAFQILTNRDIAHGLMEPEMDFLRLSSLFLLSRKRGISLDRDRIEKAARIALVAVIGELEDPYSWRNGVDRVINLLDVVDMADISVDLRSLQRVVLSLLSKGEGSPELQTVACRIGLSRDGTWGFVHWPESMS